MKIMTAATYKTLRQSTGFSQSELGRVMGVCRGTISKRERKAYPITAEASLAMQYVIEHRSDSEILSTARPPKKRRR